MAFNLDVRFENTLAQDASLPAFLVDPTRSLENSSAVQNRLASLHRRRGSPRARRRRRRRSRCRRRSGSGSPASPRRRFRTSAPPPSSPARQRWFNTAGGQPLTLASLRGRVVLVDFWTYTCINCLRTLPFLKGLYATYHPYGLEIVGIEAPEFTFEQEASNVEQAVHADGIRYPRSSRTTTSRPGTRTRTSTGRRST